MLVRLRGGEEARPEDLLAYEFGYRAQAHRYLSLDIATFYNVYTHLQTTESGVPFFEPSPAPPHLVVPTFYDNRKRGESFGFEISANWRVTSRWRLKPSYGFMRLHLHRDANSNDPDAETFEGEVPRHQFKLRSELTLPRNFELDAALFTVGRLRGQSVPAYARVDLRLGWKPGERLEFSAGVQNLFDPRHVEFVSREGVLTAPDSRKFFGKVTWRF
jgi:iron complex outermembrane receptor protein